MEVMRERIQGSRLSVGTTDVALSPVIHTKISFLQQLKILLYLPMTLSSVCPSLEIFFGI